MPKVTIYSNGQARITIPKNLVIALGLRKGDKLDFTINSRGNLELVRGNQA